MVKSLWQILMIDPNKQTLSCEECFAILELLADQAASGGNYNQIMDQAAEYLERCPDCHEQLLMRLVQLEAQGG